MEPSRGKFPRSWAADLLYERMVNLSKKAGATKWARQCIRSVTKNTGMREPTWAIHIDKDNITMRERLVVSRRIEHKTHGSKHALSADIYSPVRLFLSVALRTSRRRMVG